jgi:hypothetical protein
MEAVMNQITQNIVDGFVRESISRATARTNEERTAGYVDVEDRINHLKRELLTELSGNLAKAGESQTKSQHELEPAIDRVIEQVGFVRAEHAIREFLLKRLEDAEATNTLVTVSDVILAGASLFSGTAIAEEIDRLHREGIILWSEKHLGPNVELVLAHHQHGDG